MCGANQDERQNTVLCKELPWGQRGRRRRLGIKVWEKLRDRDEEQGHLRSEEPRSEYG